MKGTLLFLLFVGLVFGIKSQEPEEDEDDIDYEEANRLGCTLACARLLAPVCASNGRTFANECEMNGYSCIRQLGLTKLHDGHCKQ